MIFNYRLTDSEVQVRIGSWMVRRVRLADIEAADVRSWAEVLRTWHEHWSNFAPARFIVLRRKSGWIRTFVFNPPDPEGFLADLRRRLSS
ncbi:MAG TPA: hypothetical protein VGX75_16195 [bacterium]|nr:hypothetical protein [bacterium]